MSVPGKRVERFLVLTYRVPAQIKCVNIRLIRNVKVAFVQQFYLKIDNSFFSQQDHSINYPYLHVRHRAIHQGYSVKMVDVVPASGRYRKIY